MSASIIVDSLKSGGKILACGNGGSAADAQHFVGEMIERFYFDRSPLPAITLSADTSVLTALGNDYGFDTVFSRQVKALGYAEDVLIGFSTGGKSPNIIRAIEEAKKKNIKTIAFIGQQKVEQLDSCDVCINVLSQITPRIQEMHTAILHAIFEVVEREMFSDHGIDLHP